jgi:ankyrin repeat protein
MPVRPLPENPSLENLRKHAKALLDAARRGEPEALARVREFHPRPPDPLALHDAQLALARSFGFPSWPRLVHHLERVDPFAWDPSAGPAATAPVDQLIQWACLDYGRWQPGDLDRARALLAEEPALGSANIYAAAATGEVETVRALLAAQPELADARGGPSGWPPLLYACYSRLPTPTLDAARALLAAGADPDAGFLWRGNVPPFTALTGAFGEGEDGNNMPPHPARDALARALLDAGADPNDGQSLYNRHFQRDDGHLELLFEYGLGGDCGGPWVARFADRMGTPTEMLVEELWAAARKNFGHRVRLLVEHGVPVDQPGRRDGTTAYQAALMFGNHEVADYLAVHGAPRVAQSADQRFAAACIAGRADEARALLAAQPSLRDALGVHGRVALVRRAVEADHPDGVRLMAALGFELLVPGHPTPLHEAAWHGDLAMVQVLVELGASTEARDPAYGATPLGWASHNHQAEVVAYLARFMGDS